MTNREMAVDIACRLDATLGEGPVWDAARQCLWFVDIKGCRVYRFDPASGTLDHRETGAMVGWVFPTDGEELVVGLADRLAALDFDAGTLRDFVRIEQELPSNRLNDATVGPDGAIWFGTMDNEEIATSGSFYRWAGGVPTRLPIRSACVANGPAIDADRRRLYHVDTTAGCVYVSQLDDHWAIAETRPFAVIAPEDGHPDGCCTDSAGNLWLGLWGGGAARLYAPDGTLSAQIAIPASNVTKLALGGPSRRTAFVTTARIGLSENQLAKEPLAGSVFSFEVETPGLQIPAARLP